MSALTSKPRWCAAHDDYVALYDDGSFSCRYGLVVESSVKDECRVVEFPLMSVLRRLLEAAEKIRDVPASIVAADGYGAAIEEAWSAWNAAVVEARQTIGEGS